MSVLWRFFSLCACLLLTAALFPGAQYACSKRGVGFRGRGKGDGNKEPKSESHGLSKHGLKWVGAAAAGMLGGTGTRYGLGFLGKPKHGSGSHYGHQASTSDQRYNEDQRFYNQSMWRVYNTAAPGPMSNIRITPGYMVPVLIAAWIRDVW